MENPWDRAKFSRSTFISHISQAFLHTKRRQTVVNIYNVYILHPGHREVAAKRSFFSVNALRLQCDGISRWVSSP